MASSNPNPHTCSSPVPEMRPCQKFQAHSAVVNCVVHLLGGQRIMTSSNDGSLRVWNLKTGEQIGDAWWDGPNGVYDIALSPDGNKVVSGCWNGAMGLWDIDTGKIIARLTGHTQHVVSVCWNRDCGRVVSASRDGTARVWDVESRKAVLTIETGPITPDAVIISPDMAMIAIGGLNSQLSDMKGLDTESIKIWDGKTGKFITNIKAWPVRCLAWTADGCTLVSGLSDSSIRTWNTTTWQQIHVLTGHTGIVFDIAISPNGAILASASSDKTARLWNLENGLPIGSPLQHPDDVQGVSFSTDGKLLTAGCWDKNAYSWNISEIIEEAGLLKTTDSGMLLINAAATRRPGHRRRDVHRIPPRFFDDHLDSSRHPITSSACQHDVAVISSSHRHPLPDRISSLFLRNHNNVHDTSPRPRFLHSVQNIFFNLPRIHNDRAIQLQEPHPTVVDVPCTKGKPRNISGAEVRFKKEKAKKAKKPSAGNPRPPQSSAAQQCGEGAQAQPSSEPHGDVSVSPTPPAIADVSTVISTSLPDALIPRAGRWTRFRLFICCVPAQYTDAQ